MYNNGLPWTVLLYTLHFEGTHTHMHAFVESRVEVECLPLSVSTLFSKAGSETKNLELIYFVKLAGKPLIAYFNL